MKNPLLKAKEDYYTFCKYVLGFSKMTEKPHRELCEHILKPGKRKKICLVPRNSFKSSVVTTGFSIFSIVNNPNMRILIASETQKNSVKYVREIRDHFEGNGKLKALFGDMSKSSHWRENEFTVSTRTKPYKEPTVM